MTTNTNAGLIDPKQTTLKLHEQAALELVKAKGVIKADGSTEKDASWLSHLSKILVVFEAIDKSNQISLKEHSALDKANFLKEILYNSIRGCSSLDQLKDFFNSYKTATGPFAAQNPAFGNLISQMGGMINNAETAFLKKAGCSRNSSTYQNWANEELPLFTNVFHGYDLTASRATRADKAFASHTSSETETLVKAMNTLGTMSVQSLTHPGSTSGIENQD